jgi:hypothetical protein
MPRCFQWLTTAADLKRRKWSTNPRNRSKLGTGHLMLCIELKKDNADEVDVISSGLVIFRAKPYGALTVINLGYSVSCRA